MMSQFFHFFNFSASTLFLFNQVSKLYDFSILVSQLYFCSIKCLNFYIFSIFFVPTLFLFNLVFELLILFNQVFPNQSNLIRIFE